MRPDPIDIQLVRVDQSVELRGEGVSEPGERGHHQERRNQHARVEVQPYQQPARPTDRSRRRGSGSFAGTGAGAGTGTGVGRRRWHRDGRNRMNRRSDGLVRGQPEMIDSGHMCLQDSGTGGSHEGMRRPHPTCKDQNWARSVIGNGRRQARAAIEKRRHEGARQAGRVAVRACCESRIRPASRVQVVSGKTGARTDTGWVLSVWPATKPGASWV